MSSEPRKHLHIRAREGLQLRLEDAQSLLVERDGVVALRLPVPRIGVLAIEGDLALTTALLRVLTSHGVYIQLISPQGNLTTEIVQVADPSPWESELDRLLEQIDWRPSYHHWRLRQNLWAAARALGKRVSVAELLSFRHPTRLARLMLAKRPRAERVYADIQSHIHHDLMSVMAEQHWPAVHRRRHPAGPHLKRDLLHAMQYEALQQIRRSAARDSAQWYAAHREQLRARARATLDSFAAWLSQRLDHPL